MWDDALGPATLDSGGGLPPGFAPAGRRRSEPIDPRTWYAIYAGIAAVALLIVAILGHIGWRAYSDWQARRSPEPAAETAPADPSTGLEEDGDPPPETDLEEPASDSAAADVEEAS